MLLFLLLGVSEKKKCEKKCHTHPRSKRKTYYDFYRIDSAVFRKLKRYAYNSFLFIIHDHLYSNLPTSRIYNYIKSTQASTCRTTEKEFKRKSRRRQLLLFSLPSHFPLFLCLRNIQTIVREARASPCTMKMRKNKTLKRRLGPPKMAMHMVCKNVFRVFHWRTKWFHF